MVERRDSESDVVTIPMKVHFDRALREQREAIDSRIDNVEGHLRVALEHHRELHDREHFHEERARQQAEKSVNDNLIRIEQFRSEMLAHTATLMARDDFDARWALYEERHNELRNRMEGRDDVQRRDISELKQEVATIRGRSVAYITAVGVGLTVLTIVMNVAVKIIVG